MSEQPTTERQSMLDNIAPKLSEADLARILDLLSRHDRNRISKHILRLEIEAKGAAPEPRAPQSFPVHDISDGAWHTESSEGIVTCHSRVIGGVLCRWWGDIAPAGVAMLDEVSPPESKPAPVEPGGWQNSKTNPPTAEFVLMFTPKNGVCMTRGAYVKTWPDDYPVWHPLPSPPTKEEKQ